MTRATTSWERIRQATGVVSGEPADAVEDIDSELDGDEGREAAPVELIPTDLFPSYIMCSGEMRDKLGLLDVFTIEQLAERRVMQVTEEQIEEAVEGMMHELDMHALASSSVPRQVSIDYYRRLAQQCEERAETMIAEVKAGR